MSFKQHRHYGSVECYDCHQSVTDLKSHRSVCVNRKGPGGKWSNKNAPSVGNADSSSSSDSSSNSKGKSGKALAAGTKDVFVLLDVSGSMSGSPLEGAKNWIKLMENVLEEKDRFSLISFDTRAFLKLHLKPVGKLRRKKELDSTLTRIYAGNLTACYDAMCLAMEQVLDTDRESHLVVISDGEDNSSRSTSLASIEKHIREKPNIRVHFLQIGAAVDKHRQLVEATNGIYLPIDSFQTELPESILNILTTKKDSERLTLLTEV